MTDPGYKAKQAPAPELRRGFVPRVIGGRLRTIDGQHYRQDFVTGSIVRDVPKVRGKAARRQEKQLRRAMRAALAPR